MGMTIRELMVAAYANSTEKGWHDPAHPKTVGDDLMLIVTELAEAMEEHRKGYALDETYYETEGRDGQTYVGPEPAKFPSDLLVPPSKPCGLPSEMADVLIRVFDFCQHYGIDLEAAVAEKMAFNRTRPFRHGGKKL